MASAVSPAELQRRERAYRERAVTHTGDRRVRYQWRIELEAVMRRLQPRPGMRVLDAGCGVGRMSCAALRRGAEVVSLDFALSRMRYLRTQAPKGSRPEPCQADLGHLPLAERSFDAVLCTQVLEHIPEPAARRALLRDFARLLRPGGRCLLTVYNFNQPIRRRGAPREGIHDSGIFFHCYEADELRDDLTPSFEVLEVCGLIHLLPHTWRWFPLLGPLARTIDHRLERASAFSSDWGHLLLAHARVSRR
ncbi:MAG: class I SAM-dependent methyltransferase [Acidobacteria bacterium]|nr:MAG: class I SAM-dependent methyltransferase [Acidobacteriota bacterium]